MAKPGIEKWQTPEQYLRVQSWALHGQTLEEIAEQMEITVRTLHRWRRADPELDRAIKTGSETAVSAVENALYRKAIGGDLGAMCFFLKNRDPKHWCDRPELQGLEGKVVFIDDISEPPSARPAKQGQPIGDAAEQPDHP